MRLLQFRCARVGGGKCKGQHVVCNVASRKAASIASSSTLERVSDIEWASNHLPTVPGARQNTFALCICGQFQATQSGYASGHTPQLELLLLSFVYAEHVLERNSTLAAQTKDELILAPLTRGTHVPFRQLCSSFGCNVTMSEMAMARQLKKCVAS